MGLDERSLKLLKVLAPTLSFAVPTPLADPRAKLLGGLLLVQLRFDGFIEEGDAQCVSRTLHSLLVCLLRSSRQPLPCPEKSTNRPSYIELRGFMFILLWLTFLRWGVR